MKVFAAFRFRNYRLWFVGQLASLIGTWMQATAQGYLVFELTHSPVFLGYFASGAPSLLTLVGGVVSDRFPRKTILIITQVVMMLLAFILALLTFTGTINSWHIVVMAFALGIANAFDAPARQSIVIDFVDRGHLTNAIALNSTMFNAARAIGPAIAGIAYSQLGAAWCFLLNGFSFLAVIIALTMIRSANSNSITHYFCFECIRTRVYNAFACLGCKHFKRRCNYSRLYAGKSGLRLVSRCSYHRRSRRLSF